MLVVTGMIGVPAVLTVARVRIAVMITVASVRVRRVCGHRSRCGVRIVICLLVMLRVSRLRGWVGRVMRGSVVLMPPVIRVLHHGARRLLPPKKYHSTATIRIAAPATTRTSEESIGYLAWLGADG
jgi:hypothetical protein